MIPNLQNPQDPTALRSDETAADSQRGRLNQAARLSGFVLTGGRLVTGAPALPNAHGAKVTDHWRDHRARGGLSVSRTSFRECLLLALFRSGAMSPKCAA